MIVNHQIIDNFLPHNEFLQIKNFIIDSHEFPWYYNKNVTNKNIAFGGFYFVHVFYINYVKNSDHVNIINPLIKKINPHALMRIKANLYPNLNSKIENHNHRDYDFSHKAAIFYLNNNDGPTILNDEVVVDSVENRILFFDGSIIHKSVHCTDQKIRVNINFNYF